MKTLSNFEALDNLLAQYKKKGVNKAEVITKSQVGNDIIGAFVTPAGESQWKTVDSLGFVKRAFIERMLKDYIQHMY